MVLYFTSETAGIENIADEKAKLTENKMIAAFCLMDTLGEPWHWFPCDFGSDGTVQYQELWEGAFRESAEGKKGYLYELEADENDLVDDPELVSICHSKKPLAVKSVTEIPELYAWLMEEEDMGRFRLCLFENKSRQEILLWQNSILRYLAKNRMIEHEESPYAVLIKEKLPEIWRKYEKLCGK